MADLRMPIDIDMARSLAADTLGRAHAAPASKELEEIKKVAQQFESVLMSKLVEEMKNTIPDSGLLDDAAGKQLQDLFWSYMSEDIGKKGGLGLWKDLARQIRHFEHAEEPRPSLETEL